MLQAQGWRRIHLALGSAVLIGLAGCVGNVFDLDTEPHEIRVTGTLTSGGEPVADSFRVRLRFTSVLGGDLPAKVFEDASGRSEMVDTIQGRRCDSLWIEFLLFESRRDARFTLGECGDHRIDYDFRVIAGDLSPLHAGRLRPQSSSPLR